MLYFILGVFMGWAGGMLFMSWIRSAPPEVDEEAVPEYSN